MSDALQTEESLTSEIVDRFLADPAMILAAALDAGMDPSLLVAAAVQVGMLQHPTLLSGERPYLDAGHIVEAGNNVSVVETDRVLVCVAGATERRPRKPPMTRVGLDRQVAGALKSAIDAHGPITRDRVGSASKRVTGAVWAMIRPTL